MPPPEAQISGEPGPPGDGATRTIPRGGGEGEGEAASTDATPARGVPPRECVAGDSIGPFVVVRALGRGGMGTVYLAEDPRLERRVAVKVHHAMTERAVTRFEREARILARLSHPNVVAVHEVGDWEGRLYIAMEYLDGGTARQWLQTRRSTAEILGRMRSAGAGLAAAHARGLVHQDFKLDNVLVSRDGRVCVADFGVASLARSGRTEETGAGVGDRASRQTPANATNLGGGTPGYAAPEQLRGAKVDARADQFAFCVSLHEALYGSRPFPGATVDDVLDRIEAQDFAAAREARRVPGRVHRAILRGLRAAADQRHPSMATLLDRLRPSRAGRVVAGGAVAAGLVAVVASAMAREAPRCEGGTRAIGAVWSDAHRARLRQTFEATALEFAGPLGDRLASRLDTYASEWAHTYDEACDATRVEGVRSEAMLDLQAGCLQQRRRELEAVVGGLLDVGSTDVDAAHRLLATLTPVSRCADLDRLMRARDPGSTWSRSVLADPLEDELASARAQRILGRHSAAREIATDVASRARGLGDPRLLARALQESAKATKARGEIEAALALGYEAAAVAAGSNDARLRADIWATLVGWVGYDQREPAAALALARAAEANLAATADDLEVRARLENSIASVHVRARDLERAEPHMLRALELQRRALGETHDNVAGAHNNLGVLYRRWGRLADARTHLEQALSLRASAMGSTHPRLAGPHLNLANVLRDLGQPGAALEHARASSTIREAAYPDGHPDLVKSLRALGMTLSALGRDAGALQAHRRELEVARSLHEAPHELIASSLVSVASGLADTGALEEAVAQYERGLAMYDALERGQTIEVARATAHLANSLVVLQRYDEARAALDDATTLVRVLLPEGDNERLKIEGMTLAASQRLSEPAVWRAQAQAWVARAQRAEAPWLRAEARAVQQSVAAAGDRPQAGPRDGLPVAPVP